MQNYKLKIPNLGYKIVKVCYGNGYQTMVVKLFVLDKVYVVLLSEWVYQHWAKRKNFF